MGKLYSLYSLGTGASYFSTQKNFRTIHESIDFHNLEDVDSEDVSNEIAANLVGSAAMYAVLKASGKIKSNETVKKTVTKVKNSAPIEKIKNSKTLEKIITKVNKPKKED